MLKVRWVLWVLQWGQRVLTAEAAHGPRCGVSSCRQRGRARHGWFLPRHGWFLPRLWAASSIGAFIAAAGIHTDVVTAPIA